jgi:peptidoglycan LD-endopeptidase CwlK
MSSRSLTDLNPSFYPIAEQFMVRCEHVLPVHQIIITCTYRSKTEQDTLYAQGRHDLKLVNLIRAQVKLLPITEKDNKIVTNAKGGESFHNYRLAFDIVPSLAGKLIWNTSDPVWKKLSDIAIECRIDWGGNWKIKDYPHFQFQGITLADLREEKLP